MDDGVNWRLSLMSRCIYIFTIYQILTAKTAHLKDASPDMKAFTVEWLAERAGINKNILYKWVESDAEFTTALEWLKEAKKNDPLKTGTEEDTFVTSMMIALLLLETKDRHYKSQDS